MSFEKRFPWLFYRKLKVDILTLFLSLICVSFACVISFTYFQYSKSIFTFSKGTVTRVADVVIQRLNCFINNVQSVPSTGKSLVQQPLDVSPDNRYLEHYLLNEVKYRGYFSGLYVGVESGAFMGASNLHLYGQTHYLSDPSKTLPEGSVFALYMTDPSQVPPTQTWYYKDSNLRTLGSEVLTHVTFDPRNRPWYEGAKKTHHLFWTDLYRYYPTGESGLSVGIPLQDEQKEFFGVFGIDLSLVFFSEFLSSQHVGKSGVVCMLDDQGEYVVPHEQMPVEKEHAISLAYQKFKKDGEETFVIETSGIKYLTYINQFSIAEGRTWLIVVSTPLDDFFEGLFQTQQHVVLMTLGILILVGLVVIYHAKRISKPIVRLTEEVDKIQRLDLSSEVRVQSHILEVNLLDLSIASMRMALRSFAKYVPKEIVKQLFHQGKEISLGGEKKEITIFFSDIQGFTPISDTLPTEQLMLELSGYFDLLSKIILQSGGTIDKYIGDSIMAFWGAPLENKQHAEQACTVALLCQQALIRFNQKQKENGLPELPTSFGINTGVVIVGNIGTLERMNYTVIGDVVNVASRLQKLDRYYHAGIIISEAVKKVVEKSFVIRPLEDAQIKGKKEKVKVFQLVGAKRGGDLRILATEEQIALVTRFSEAYEAYVAGDTSKAFERFTALAKDFPQDYPTQVYLERLNKS